MENVTRTATLGIAKELRNMEVGDVVKFPLPQYKYTSIRTMPSTALVNEQMEGRKWTARLDRVNKCVFVTRVS